MKNFSQLISAIEITNKTNVKIAALIAYFRTAPDKDKLWLIALFTGKRPSRPVSSKLLKEWCIEISQNPINHQRPSASLVASPRASAYCKPRIAFHLPNH